MAAKEWRELDFEEREIYFQWIWILMDDGKLHFDNMDDIEAYAKEMYMCDVDQTPDHLLKKKRDDDDFKGLDVNWQDYL